MKAIRQTFKNQTLTLDDNVFVECKFISCTIVYSGARNFNLTSNEFHDCSWTFDGPAEATLNFFKIMYHGGFDKLIKATFEEIMSQAAQQQPHPFPTSGSAGEICNSKYYIHLEKKEYAKTWIDGGSVPIFLAKKYYDIERVGTQTPDEVRIREIKGMSYEKLNEVVGKTMFVPPKGTKITDLPYGLEMSGNLLIVGDEVILDGSESYQSYFENVYVLSLSFSSSKEINQRLGKTVCIEILDIQKLKSEFDKQLAKEGIMGPCQYTSTLDRNHFLKDEHDAWQQEYRIIWPAAVDAEKQVILEVPKAIAREIEPQ